MWPLRRSRRAEREPPGPGEVAIDAHVASADGAPATKRFHPRPVKTFGGDPPLEAVALHRLSSPDHWHLVGYGLSDLRSKTSTDADWSGFGFELTIRVA